MTVDSLHGSAPPLLRVAEGTSLAPDLLEISQRQLKQHDPLASSEIGSLRRLPEWPLLGDVAGSGEAGLAGLTTQLPALRPAAAGAKKSSLLAVGVPPVGVEPTLGTLLGGRPLPLGYGGWVMIPRPVRTILARANRERKIHPGAHIQFVADGP